MEHECMSRDPDTAALMDLQLTLDELCRAAAVEAAWVTRRVEEGLLPAPDGSIGAWRFDTVVVTRVRRMRRVEQDFDAVPELAALVADLQDEIERLRRLLRN
jgi:chaperone modulatory protein CbpM